jgi:catechol 2,3-dioxygenase-like lactoylglutathione lyase family enzyme
MNLPVRNLEAALPFYETVLGFQVLSTNEQPYKTAVLGRDNIQIGLSENGGEPEQDGCFFEVDDVIKAFEELKSNGLKMESADFKMQKHGLTSWKVFFIVAPDGLCYCLGEKQA